VPETTRWWTMLWHVSNAGCSECFTSRCPKNPKIYNGEAMAGDRVLKIPAHVNFSIAMCPRRRGIFICGLPTATVT